MAGAETRRRPPRTGSGAASSLLSAGAGSAPARTASDSYDEMVLQLFYQKYWPKFATEEKVRKVIRSFKQRAGDTSSGAWRLAMYSALEEQWGEDPRHLLVSRDSRKPLLKGLPAHAPPLPAPSGEPAEPGAPSHYDDGLASVRAASSAGVDSPGTSAARVLRASKNVHSVLRNFDTRGDAFRQTMKGQAPGPSSTNVWRQTQLRLIDAFRIFDADNDGQLSLDEMRQGLTGLARDMQSSGGSSGLSLLSPADIEALIRAADTDGNGTIDYREFVRLLAPKTGSRTGADRQPGPTVGSPAAAARVARQERITKRKQAVPKQSKPREQRREQPQVAPVLSPPPSPTSRDPDVFAATQWAAAEFKAQQMQEQLSQQQFAAEAARAETIEQQRVQAAALRAADRRLAELEARLGVRELSASQLQPALAPPPQQPKTELVELLQQQLAAAARLMEEHRTSMAEQQLVQASALREGFRVCDRRIADIEERGGIVAREGRTELEGGKLVETETEAVAEAVAWQAERKALGLLSEEEQEEQEEGEGEDEFGGGNAAGLAGAAAGHLFPARVEAVFKLLDKNGDGTLTRGELNTALKKCGTHAHGGDDLGHEDVREVLGISAMRTDEDRRQFELYQQLVELKPVYQQLDGDDDKRITMEEFMAYFESAGLPALNQEAELDRLETRDSVGGVADARAMEQALPERDGGCDNAAGTSVHTFEREAPGLGRAQTTFHAALGLEQLEHQQFEAEAARAALASQQRAATATQIASDQRLGARISLLEQQVATLTGQTDSLLQQMLELRMEAPGPRAAMAGPSTVLQNAQRSIGPESPGPAAESVAPEGEPAAHVWSDQNKGVAELSSVLRSHSGVCQSAADVADAKLAPKSVPSEPAAADCESSGGKSSEQSGGMAHRLGEDQRLSDRLAANRAAAARAAAAGADHRRGWVQRLAECSSEEEDAQHLDLTIGDGEYDEYDEYEAREDSAAAASELWPEDAGHLAAAVRSFLGEITATESVVVDNVLAKRVPVAQSLGVQMARGPQRMEPLSPDAQGPRGMPSQTSSVTPLDADKESSMMAKAILGAAKAMDSSQTSVSQTALQSAQLLADHAMQPRQQLLQQAVSVHSSEAVAHQPPQEAQTYDDFERALFGPNDGPLAETVPVCEAQGGAVNRAEVAAAEEVEEGRDAMREAGRVTGRAESSLSLAAAVAAIEPLDQGSLASEMATAGRPNGRRTRALPMELTKAQRAVADRNLLVALRAAGSSTGQHRVGGVSDEVIMDEVSMDEVGPLWAISRASIEVARAMEQELADPRSPMCRVPLPQGVPPPQGLTARHELAAAMCGDEDEDYEEEEQQGKEQQGEQEEREQQQRQQEDEDEDVNNDELINEELQSSTRRGRPEVQRETVHTAVHTAVYAVGPLSEECPQPHPLSEETDERPTGLAVSEQLLADAEQESDVRMMRGEQEAMEALVEQMEQSMRG